MVDVPAREIPPAQIEFIERAANYLSHPSFLMRVANLLGKPVEMLASHLPDSVRSSVSTIVERALTQALEGAILTLPSKEVRQPVDVLAVDGGWRRWQHNLAAGVTGAVGGVFGVKALALELPVTSTIILRNIASVAQSLGEDVNDPMFKLQCLSVFSVAFDKDSELSALESTYYTTRVALAKMMREASQYVARVSTTELARDLAAGASPVLVRFIAQVASRFNVVVSEKLVAQAVPGIGAVGGALVNVAFNDHFDRVARHHFGLRALEREFGNEAVQRAYEAAVLRKREPGVTTSRAPE